MRFLIATDLDGTLLDHYSYAWQAANEAIKNCHQRKIPIVFNTSKTLAEVRQLQVKIGITGPMIVENGGALILPMQFDGQQLDTSYLDSLEIVKTITESKNAETQIIFGEQRSKLLQFVERVRKREGWKFEGFSDWTVSEIADKTGLELQEASAASAKKYSEPFVWNDSDTALEKFVERARDQSFDVLRGGRFYHLQGDTNKAIPITWLRAHFFRLYGANGASVNTPSSKVQPELICLGDSQNDVDMLNVADYPVCVRSPIAPFPNLQTNREVIYTEGEGPVGWNEVVNKIITL